MPGSPLAVSVPIVEPVVVNVVSTSVSLPNVSSNVKLVIKAVGQF